jgi:glycosyltransferase involved in cell wall biosynthesis
LRVIHLANYGGPYPGSFIPMVEAAARAVRERGGEATLAFSESARERSWMRQLEAGQVPVAVAPRGDDRAKARWIAELAGNGDHPTILHTHFTTFDLPALRAARGRPRTAVLWNMHTSLRQERSMRLRNSAKFALAGRRVAAIVCVGESIAAEVGARHAPSGRVVVLQNAIDVERFPPIDAARRSEARRRLGLDEGLPVLLHFGWDWHVKGGDLLAEAVQRLARVGPVAALSVGCDPKVVAAQSERLGLPEGALRVLEPTDDVAGLYAAADVFAATSRAEAPPSRRWPAACLWWPPTSRPTRRSHARSATCGWCPTTPMRWRVRSGRRWRETPRPRRRTPRAGVRAWPRGWIWRAGRGG